MPLKSLHFLLIVSIATFLGGCKLAEKVQEPDLAKMPEQFQPSLKPTLSQSLLPWREYFTDSSLVIYIDEALKSNLDLKIALQRVSMAGASVTMARGALLPSMNAVTSVGQQRFGEYTMDGVGNFDTNFSVNVPPDRRIPVNLPDYYLGFQSSWEVAAWGKLRNRKKAAAARFFASDKAKHLIQTMLVSERCASTNSCNTYYSPESCRQSHRTGSKTIYRTIAQHTKLGGFGKTGNRATRE
jgi:outer membrane protein TolC